MDELSNADPSGGKDAPSCRFNKRYLDQGWVKIHGVAIKSILFLGKGMGGEGMQWIVEVSVALVEIGRKSASEDDHVCSG